MATNFPTSLDTTTQLPDSATPTSSRSNPDLAGTQNNQSDAILALEAKVGVDNSTDSTSLDYKVTHTLLPLAGGTMTGPISGFQDKGGQVFSVGAYSTAQDAINAAVAATVPATVWFPSVVQEAVSITNATAPITLAGPGGVKLPASSASGTAAIKVTNSPNVTVSIRVDQNGANQTNTVYGVYYDTSSSDLVIDGCYMPNVKGYVVMSNGGVPTSRTTNVRVTNNIIACTGIPAQDILVVVADGGQCSGNVITGVGSAAGLSIYESDDVPTFGNVVYGTGNAGVLLRVSSSMGCAVTGNTLVGGGTSDFCIQIEQETDNSTSRAQTDGLIANNICRVGQAVVVGNSATSQNTVSGVSILGNTFNSCFSEIEYNYNATISDIVIEGNHSISVGGGGHFVENSTPTGEVRRNNKGYNPVGAVTVAVPATGVATAALPYDATFYVKTGDSTSTFAISNGVTVSPAASGVTVPIFVPAGETLTPTYTTAPTWVVQGN